MEQQNASVPAMKYAGFGIRFLAFILDTVVYYLIAWLIWGDKVVSSSNGNFNASLTNEQLLIPLAYFIIFWLVFSSSPGKMICGLKIRKTNGSKIGIKEVLIRVLVYIIIFIGAWFILGNQKKQALHDMAAGTVVVKR